MSEQDNSGSQTAGSANDKDLVPSGNACPGGDGAAPVVTAEVTVRAAPGNTLPEKNQHSEDTEDIKKIGKNLFAAVYIPASDEEQKNGIVSGVIKFSEQEAAVLKAFMRTADYQKTADEVKIKVESVKRILRRPNLRRFINYQISRLTVEEGMDPTWAKTELRDVWDGKRKPSEDAKWAMQQIVKLVQPKSGIQVNVQNNQSVYGNMSKDAIDAEWANARTAAA